MSQLQNRLSELITRIGTEFKTVKIKLTGNSTGDLSGLNTTVKTNMLDAVNSLKAEVDVKQPNLGFTPENIINKGASGGYAPLDATSKVPLANLPALAPSNSDNTSTAISSATAKTTLVDADTIPLSDSAASNGLKKISFLHIKAVLKTYFDTLYNKYIHPNHSGDIVSSGDGSTTIQNNVVSNTKLSTVATATIKGRTSAGTGNVEDLTPAAVRTLLNVADGANNYSHPTGFTNRPAAALSGATVISQLLINTNGHVTEVSSRDLTKSDLGLGNVTNFAQVKKSPSSTIGNIPVWSAITGDELGAGFSVESTLIGSASALPNANAVKTYIDGLLGANDAMLYKGTLGTGGTFTTLPTTYSPGWTFKVISAGTYAGSVAEVGDMFIATTARTGTGNLNSDWTVVQSNIDGAVVGPASSTNDHIALFSGTSGKVLKSANAVLGNGILTVQGGGIATGTGTFNANATGNNTITISVPGSNLTEGTRTGTSVAINSSTGTAASLSVATTTLAGLLSAADKTTINNLGNINTDLVALFEAAIA